MTEGQATSPYLQGVGKTLIAGILIFSLVAGKAQPVLIAPEVRDALNTANPNTELSVIVRYSDAVDVRDSEPQKLLRETGAGDMVVLWIINSIAVTVSAEAIETLTHLPGVDQIRLDRKLDLPASQSG